MPHSKTKKITPAERERRVWEASRRYARGEITAEDFAKEERQNTPDYKAAMAGLSETYVGRTPNGGDKAAF